MFAGHDPGSLNHLRPIAARALASGLLAAAPVINLRPKHSRAWGGVIEAREILHSVERKVRESSSYIAACIVGISTNQAEIDIARAVSEQTGSIFVGLVCDFSIGRRLDSASDVSSLVNCFMFSSDEAMKEAYSLHSELKLKACVIGSTYLDDVIDDECSPSQHSVKTIRAKLGLDREVELFPFFLASDDVVPNPESGFVSAVRSLRDALTVTFEAEFTRRRFVLVACPHPRSSTTTRQAIQQYCQNDPAVLYAGELLFASEIDNKSLCFASAATFSMGSTLSLESIAWRTPSAFWRGGWDHKFVEKMTRSTRVTEILSQQHLCEWLKASLLDVGDEMKILRQHCLSIHIGATARAWEHIFRQVCILHDKATETRRSCAEVIGS